MRSTALDVARRAFNMVTRGTIHSVDDSTKIQNMAVRLYNNELITGVEHFQHYGFRSSPPPPGNGAAEVVVAFVGGARSHPVVVATNDRRTRPLNAEAGASGLWHYLGHIFDLTSAGAVYTAGPKKLPFTIPVGNATLTIADGKITAVVNMTKIVVEDGAVYLGGDPADGGTFGQVETDAGTSSIVKAKVG